MKSTCLDDRRVILAVIHLRAMGRAFVICGSPGAGKSVYGAKLAAQHRAILLDIDTCTEGLIQVSLVNLGHDPADRDSAYFKDTFREPIYQTLFSIAKENLAWVDTVIVGPFTREIRDAEWPTKLRQILAAEVEIHYICCSQLERRRRLELRGDSRDIPKLRDWDKHVRYLGDEQPPKFPHVFVDTSELKKL
ncbi:MAG: ATP-binding protein [Oligoflexia bacterium]|nr:ATP-binding protein [Oligoflexia bacterium]